MHPTKRFAVMLAFAPFNAAYRQAYSPTWCRADTMLRYMPLSGSAGCADSAARTAASWARSAATSAALQCAKTSKER